MTFALAGLTLVWGTQFLVMKRAMADLPPLLLGALRYGVLAVVAQVAILHFKVPEPERKWSTLRLIYAMSQAFASALLYWGQARTASSVVGVLTAASPVLVALMAHRFVAEERMDRRGLAASLVGLTGAVLLVAGTGATAPTSLAGVLAVTVATMAATSTKLTARHLTLRLPAAVLLRDLGLGVGVTLGLASWLGEGDLPVRWTAEAVAAVAWLGLVGSAAATGVWLVLLRHVPVARLSYLQFGNAAVALVVGVWLGGEAWSQGQALGTLLVVLGGVLVVRGRLPRPVQVPAVTAEPALSRR